jgi:hypothetical protein
MVHFNSFQSLQKGKEIYEGKQVLDNRRLGLMIRSGGFYHFRQLNEAVTEELAIRFTNRVARHLDYLKDMWDVLRIGEFNSGIYSKEREELNNVINDIFEANNGEFSNREEVFRLFVDGAMKGRILPLARAYEKAYGRGSFQEFAEEQEELAA